LALAGISFTIGAIVSLATSWVLVTRLERVGERFGLSEALLGIVAALAADAPEITFVNFGLFAASTNHRCRRGDRLERLQPGALLGVAVLVSGSWLSTEESSFLVDSSRCGWRFAAFSP